ncbi:Hypothetical Protein FCC1311_094012 [Hondaea fermentalgiana]|uniref:BZIP domain-containing protein n=1 Tax=Hondaea fermentalgiana TaxID=2315210 RepID=A0A2R5GQM5_9STRA|nr:Hypothetical Protein FCC1311_094012 [Hondaea fermentalgiana]|eukprot:GBG33177.1 Hypothetical Protein FCC1311_094012 [Hondaea fermentalgiana]
MKTSGAVASSDYFYGEDADDGVLSELKDLLDEDVAGGAGLRMGGVKQEAVPGPGGGAARWGPPTIRDGLAAANGDNAGAIALATAEECDAFGDGLQSVSSGDNESSCQYDGASCTASSVSSKKPSRSKAKSRATCKLGQGQGHDSGDSEAADSKVRRRNTNAEASRRSRLKRKADMERLRERNEELEQDRDLFLERIAELQLEVSTLRHAGSIDIARENELLRAEIRKHKMFVSSIVRATREAPQMLLEERVRLLKSGIDSSLAQVIGLVHTSTNWPEHSFVPETARHQMRIQYHFLPEGARREEIKRLGLRLEAYNFELDAQEMGKAMWELNRTQLGSRQLKDYRTKRDGIERGVERFVSDEFARALEMLDEELDVESYYEKHEREDNTFETVRALFARTYAERTLSPHAFFCTGDGASAAHESRAEIRESVADGVASCSIIATSEFTKQLIKAQLMNASETTSDTRLMDTSLIHGYVILPSSPDPGSGAPRCHCISVISMPVGYFSGIRSTEHAITKDNELADAFLSAMVSDTEHLWESCMATHTNSVAGTDDEKSTSTPISLPST